MGKKLEEQAGLSRATLEAQFSSTTMVKYFSKIGLADTIRQYHIVSYSIRKYLTLSVRSR